MPGLVILNKLTNPILPKGHSRLATQDRQPIGEDLTYWSQAGEKTGGIQTQDWPSKNTSSMGWPMGKEEKRGTLDEYKA